MKKGIIITANILLGLVIAVAISFLIFGADTIFIADYMPPVISSKPPFYAYVILYLLIHLSILLIPITIIALLQIFILNKNKILFIKKDILTVLLFWIIPLIGCAIKLIPQYGFTW